jgi:hypothetical protein
MMMQTMQDSAPNVAKEMAKGAMQNQQETVEE